jgi:diguanylate cyclase (GGDEF)-like protein
VDVLLLDVTDSADAGLDTLRRARVEAPEIPVVLLAPAGAASDVIGSQAAQAGAQDVVCRDQLDASDLRRVLRYAIERHRLQATLRQLALSDELTGLYNRRGFLALCEHHLKLAHRMRGLMLAVVDVDHLREINNRFGRDEGDRALLAAASVLRGTFRASDVIARFAGDDFAVLVLDATEDALHAVTPRLVACLAHQNSSPRDRDYALALSMGVVRFEPTALPAIEELLVKAEEELGRQKRSR